MSGFLTRSYPIGGTLKFDGDKIPDTSFDRAIGGGLKIGVFPSYKSIFGAEVEASIHRGTIRAPQTVLGNTVRSAQLDMTAFNFMVNAPSLDTPATSFSPTQVSASGSPSWGWTATLKVPLAFANPTHCLG